MVSQGWPVGRPTHELLSGKLLHAKRELVNFNLHDRMPHVWCFCLRGRNRTVCSWI